ncbi:Ger(x)C family spore germination protein [Herbivorax sp. ANBcel31]|uniref:Ger(x)C family spore germination protein n=1 Tax=Herbivorax sp. ANBcel31 TaxID=3069754 RepID=UPI0027ADC8FA|nr:Ger(x)C family spore germination protein [Herbivorax sp. ANBcel31]MDQ2087280.1 Ger(x)C family spore germination protein [Herbivorax sp. ANBcel31]
MHSKIISLIITLSILVTFTSCHDSKEITDFTYILLIGIDEGDTDEWKITFVMPLLGGSGGSEGGDMSNDPADVAPSMDSLTIEAPSFFAGLQLANSILPREINLMHTQAIVFSEALARSGKVGEFIAPIIRYKQLRHNVNIAVSRASARELVENFKPYTGSNISRTVDGIVKSSRNVGYYISTTLHDFYDCMKSTYHQPILLYTAVNKGKNLKKNKENLDTSHSIAGNYIAGDIPREGGSKLEFMGLAVFEGDTMVGTITGHETILWSMSRGVLERSIFTIKDPKAPDLAVPILTRLASSPSIKVNFEETKPIIQIELELEGDIFAIQSRFNYEDPKLKPILEDALEEFILSEFEKVIDKSLNWNCDFFKFGHTAVKKFATIDQWEEYDWNKSYKNAEITASVDVEIVRTGKMLYSSPIIKSGGENN